MCKILAKRLMAQEDCITTSPTIADLVILLVVVHIIVVTATNLLKMKMAPATS